MIQVVDVVGLEVRVPPGSRGETFSLHFQIPPELLVVIVLHDDGVDPEALLTEMLRSVSAWGQSYQNSH